jgi:type VI protein secretion system component VasF
LAPANNVPIPPEQAGLAQEDKNMPYTPLILVLLLFAVIVVAAYFYLKRAQARPTQASPSSESRTAEDSGQER